MTLDEILSNEELRRNEFPVVRNEVFLAHAGVCPLPRRVADGMVEYVQGATRGDQEAFIYPGILKDARRLAANLLGCHADEIALVGPTSLALSLVASGLSFRRGDNVLIYFDDYPSNVYPWMALAERGVQVRLMNTRGLGLIRPMDVLGQVDENTRLVALASCHFISGYRIDVPGIGRQLREKRILFCVDGIQTLGAFPTPVEHVDILAADAHKWLLGPSAAGLLYVRREVRDIVNPPIYGWHNVRCPNFVAGEQIVFQADSRKFEVGTHNLAGAVGLVRALELILEVGVENIGRELLRKRHWLVPALLKKGYSVLHGDASSEAASGIVSFFNKGQDPSPLFEKLRASGIMVSLRVDRSGQRYIRISPHFYNTDAELERCLEVL